MTGYAAVVLAGGAGRRMGRIDKPRVPVAGRAMLDRVLDAVADAYPRVLVGPDGAVPPGVRMTRERPAGGGPVAAAEAGLALVPPETPSVALLAADLPLLTGAAVADLRRRLAAGDADGVCYTDGDGRPQPLCGVWRAEPLRRALRDLAGQRGGALSGASMRALLGELAVVGLPWNRTGPPPWFDCDTEDDVRRAEEWMHERAG